MNKELKEGLYIRTKDKNNSQYIRKIVDLPKDTRNGSIVVDKYIHNVKWVSKKNVLKTSENIIDLIEVGDYVNGEKVTSVEPVDEKDTERYLGFGDYDYYIHTSEDIKSVVTKEQFEAMKYVVERDKKCVLY